MENKDVLGDFSLLVKKCLLIEKNEKPSVTQINFFRGHLSLTAPTPNAGSFFVLVNLIVLSNFSRV